MADSRVVTGHHSGSGGRRLQLQDQGHSLSYIAETGRLNCSRLDVGDFGELEPPERCLEILAGASCSQAADLNHSDEVLAPYCVSICEDMFGRQRMNCLAVFKARGCETESVEHMYTEAAVTGWERSRRSCQRNTAPPVTGGEPRMFTRD